MTNPTDTWQRLPRTLAGTAALEQAPIPVLWVGEDGSIGYANKAALELLPAQEIGGSLWDLDPAWDESRWTGEILPKAQKAGRLHDLPISCSGRDLVADVVSLDIAGNHFASLYLSEPAGNRPTSTSGDFPSFLSSFRTAVAFLDSSGTIVGANPAFARLVDKSSANLPGKPLEDIIDQSQLDDTIRKGLEERRVKGAELKYRTSAGKSLHLKLSLVPNGETGGSILTLDDLSDEKHLEHALTQIEESFEVLAANVPGMLYRFVLTPDGKTFFPYCSPGCEDIWGIKPEDIAEDSTPMVSLIHPDDIGSFQQTVIESATTLGNWEFEGRMTTPDGVKKWFHAASRPQLQDSGDIHWQGLLMDISDQKKIEAELKDARTKAEIAAKAKSDFLANMSHEIRTPMNGVMGMTDLLIRTDLDDKQRRYLDTIRSSAEVLLTIINDVLDVSKMEAGKLELYPISFDLRQMIEEVCTLLGTGAFKKGLEVVVAYDPDAPAKIIGDSMRLRQVLANLIGNAVKFTSEGHILVRVQLESREGENATIKVSVTDTGIGIDQKVADRLFAQFVQADNSTSREFGGTGLGLSISQKLIGLMGSRIEISSSLGKGSTFFFTLEVPVAGGDVETDGRIDQLAGRDVLIVDDYEVNREMLNDVVGGWGLNPVLANSGDDALRVMRNFAGSGNPIEIVLLDYQMPGMDGLDLARAICAEPDIAGAQMILISSSTLDDDILRQLALARVSRTLMKPVRQAELKTALVDTLIPSLEEEPIESTIDPDIEGMGLTVLLVEDNPVNQVVASEMLENLGCTVEFAADGQIAVERVRENSYDMVFMDCQMPKMDGFEATRAIRKLDLDPQPPIIAMTAHAMDGDRERCLQAGMDDYLSKPVNRDRIRKKIIQHSTREHQETTPEPPEDLGPVFDRKSADQLTNDSEPMLKRLIAKWAENCDGWVEELQGSLNSGQIDQARNLAHTIRGASGYIGATALNCRATQIEESLSEKTVPEIKDQAKRLNSDATEFRNAAREAGLWPEEN